MAKRLPQIKKLASFSKDIHVQAASMELLEVRFLVDHMYRIQKQRKAIKESLRILEEKGASHNVAKFVANNSNRLENEIAKLLDVATDQYVPARWVKRFDGLDTRMAAGLMGWVDINKCEYPGQLWSFAGQNPSQRWYTHKEAVEIVKYAQQETGIGPSDLGDALIKVAKFIAEELNRNEEGFLADSIKFGNIKTRIDWSGILATTKKRPWHGMMKQHCYNLSKCLQRKRTWPYRDIYDKRKVYEQKRNEAGLYKEQAEEALERYTYDKTTVAYPWYKRGKLPPGHIDRRCLRHMVKILLGHYHQVLYYHHHGREAPKVYILTVGDEEENAALKEIPCPYWPFGKRGKG